MSEIVKSPQVEPDRSKLTQSALDINTAKLRCTVPAGEGWLRRLNTGEVLRIVDLEGNQAVDTIFFSADTLQEVYSAQNTIREQGSIYLTTGSVLFSNMGRRMLQIVADTCGRHDTLGGACAAESNMVRYGLEKRFMHNCRDTFLLLLQKAGLHLDKRAIAHNINFFMNVPVTSAGGLMFADGISDPGKYVELAVLQPLWCLVSNCPQLNNPCNAYNPTPIEMVVWETSDA
ncbi:MAG: urea amidolyase associated protein UAAP2 [Verrucomicrobiales bacterium]